MTRARDIANVTVTPTFPDGSINIADLNIDGGTDIGAALVDADLMVVDDGAGGTNKKATMSRLATYMGTKIGGGGLEFIASTDASGSAALAFTGFDSSKYDSYEFTFANILPATDDVYLQARASVDGGSNYLSASDSYTILLTIATAAGDSTAIYHGYQGIGNAASDAGFSGTCNIFSPQLNVPTYIHFSGISTLATGVVARYGLILGSGKTKVATIVNAIQFSMTSGNIASGTITMYGRVNS